ncbi:MAG: hypothetical protein V3W44_02900, partial [Dehalococcoidales bacterium]
TDIGEGTFDYSFDDAKIAKEAVTDGVFVIRTSLPRTDRSSAQVVLTYKLLTQVERAFRAIKTSDTKIRPIYHWTESECGVTFFYACLHTTFSAICSKPGGRYRSRTKIMRARSTAIRCPRRSGPTQR